jgi:Glycoside Hydrolase Family 113
MQRAHRFLLPGLFLAAASAAWAAPATVPAKMRGVSWVAGGEISAASFDSLVAVGADWIVQTPFGWQQSVESTEVGLVTDGRILWGERDAGLELTTRLARERGIETLLKPHIWLRRNAGGAWRGQIAMQSDADWAAWFASYRRFILHYAALAERLAIPMLAVGTELHATAVQRPDDWRRLIADVRAVYSGQLTYSANWYREFEEIRFWDALDAIGIQAYFPLAGEESPSLESLTEAWRRHLPAVAAVAARFGKPVIFTEVGYRSSADAAIEPWAWPQDQGEASADVATQARCYEAFFATAWQAPWLAGAFIWKWYPEAASARRATDFTPQGKPAEKVLAAHYLP